MSFKSIKEVFDYHCTATVDDKFAIAMIVTWQKFISRSDSHSKFFNSPYVGVYPIRYLTSDAMFFLEELLGIEDPVQCQTDLFALKTVDENHKVASDVVNLAYMYAVFRLFDSNVNRKYKEPAMVHTVAMAITKHLCSQITRRFKFNADPAIAAQLYESLDNKTDLKRLGDWKSLLLERGEDFISPRGIHSKFVAKMSPDERILYATGDIQDRIVGVLNLLTSKFHDIKDQQGKILSMSTIGSDIDGEKVLRDFARKENELKRVMSEIAEDPRDLIRQQLIDFTSDLITSANADMLEKTLEYFSDNFNAMDKKSHDSPHRAALDRLVVYVIHEAKVANLDLSNIPQVVARIKNIFRSSRTKKPDVIEIKNDFTMIVNDAIPRARDSVKVSCTIAMVIYLTLRMLSINHYG
ncbi:hypothetical protein [Vibrio phage BONAISHI]|nr:hypothetical protein [Vibrio phage BONAISHI]